MSFHTTNLNGEKVYACPFEKHMYTEEQLELKFFKCYRSEVSCIDCEFKEPCNVFVYVKQQVELDTPSFKKEREKTKEKAIKEAQMYVVAGLSLTRPVSIDDVRWAVERGFEYGRQFSLKEKGKMNEG